MTYGSRYPRHKDPVLIVGSMDRYPVESNNIGDDHLSH